MIVGCLILASCAKNEKQNTEKKEEQKTEQKAETQSISLFAAASLEKLFLNLKKKIMLK